MKKDDKTLIGGIAVLGAIGAGLFFWDKKKKEEAAKKPAQPTITQVPNVQIPQGMPQGIPANLPSIPAQPAPAGGGATPVSAAQDALNQAAAAAGLPTAPKVF